MQKRTVAETMTRKPIVLSPETTVDRAIEIAQDRKIHHLLVDSDDGLVRVLCLCDLLHGEPLHEMAEGVSHLADNRAVAHLAHHRTYVIGPGDDLHEAGDLMAREGIGCLPVVKNGEIVGVLTRADLRASGEEFDAILDARCASCGSTEDVRHVVPGGAGFCPDCLSHAGPPARDDEIGAGD